MPICCLSRLALSLVLVAAGADPPPQLLPEKSIPLSLAVTAARAAVDACAARRSAVTVEVVDLNGLIKVLLSADGARTNSFDYARRKAYTVLRKGVPSGDFGRSLGTPTPTPPFEGDSELIQYAGALPILRGATMVGAISVSGPTGQADDEACARAGLATISDKLQRKVE